MADGVVACFAATPDLTRIAEAVCGAEGLVLLALPLSVLRGMPMICALVFLVGLLDPAYVDVTYLDADT